MSQNDQLEITLDLLQFYLEQPDELTVDASAGRLDPDQVAFAVIAMNSGVENSLKLRVLNEQWMRKVNTGDFYLPGKNDALVQKFARQSQAMLSQAKVTLGNVRDRNPDLWECIEDSSIVGVVDLEDDVDEAPGFEEAGPRASVSKRGRLGLNVDADGDADRTYSEETLEGTSSGDVTMRDVIGVPRHDGNW